MALVHHPDPAYTGTARIGRRTLTFRDGVAETDGGVAAFRRAGYRVTPTAPAPSGGGVVDLDAMTVPELRKHATRAGVEVPADARKTDIISAITAAQVHGGSDD